MNGHRFFNDFEGYGEISVLFRINYGSLKIGKILHFLVKNDNFGTINFSIQYMVFGFFTKNRSKSIEKCTLFMYDNNVRDNRSLPGETRLRVNSRFRKKVSKYDAQSCCGRVLLCRAGFFKA